MGLRQSKSMIEGIDWSSITQKYIQDQFKTRAKEMKALPFAKLLGSFVQDASLQLLGKTSRHHLQNSEWLFIFRQQRVGHKSDH